jgi:hypothetical protein
MAGGVSKNNGAKRALTAAQKAALDAGRGRTKGTPNKMTTQVKEMILLALDKAGGADYLAQQAEESPAAFMSLVGKVLPLQLTGDGGGPIQTQDVTEDREKVLGLVAQLAARATNAERPTLQ